MMKQAQLYVIKLGKEMTSRQKAMLLPLIPEEKRAQINKFYHWQDAQRTLLGYSMASYLLTSQFGLPKKIRYNFDYYGKPTIAEKEIFFNISHAGEWIACGLSQKTIGVDVEKVTPIDLTLAEHFFAQREVTDLFNLPAELRTEYFFKLWTLKESYIKAEGKGISIPLNSFWFRVFQEQIHFFPQSTEDWHYKLYDFDQDYKLAVCMLGKDLPKKVQVLTHEDLIKDI